MWKLGDLNLYVECLLNLKRFEVWNHITWPWGTRTFMWNLSSAEPREEPCGTWASMRSPMMGTLSDVKKLIGNTNQERYREPLLRSLWVGNPIGNPISKPIGNPVWEPLGSLLELWWELGGIQQKAPPACPETFIITMAENPKLPAVGENVFGRHFLVLKLINLISLGRGPTIFLLFDFIFLRIWKFGLGANLCWRTLLARPQAFQAVGEKNKPMFNPNSYAIITSKNHSGIQTARYL